MKNNIDQIYKEFGEDICLFPFLAAFYTTFNIPYDPAGNKIAPCSLYANHKTVNDGIINSINTDEWKDLRKNFTKGSCHTWEHCKKCSNAEKAFGHSSRVLNNSYFADHLQVDIVDEVKHIIDNDYTVEKIYSLDFFPSNYCNYECIMCNATSSSSRYVFDRKIYFLTNVNLNPNEKIEFLDADRDFEEVLSTVEIINFAGGETLMQQQVHKVIDLMIEKDLAKNVTISLLTNASKFPERLLVQLQQFKNVFYTISIDGIGDVIEYQRRGSKWSVVEETALKINQQFGSVVNYVATAVNVFRFAEFIEWASKNKIDKVILSIVFDKEYLSVSVIPNELKDKIIANLQTEKTKHTQYYADLLDQMISVLNANKHTPELLPEFIERIKIEDTASKKPLVEVIPEWAPYLNA